MRTTINFGALICLVILVHAGADDLGLSEGDEDVIDKCVTDYTLQLTALAASQADASARKTEICNLQKKLAKCIEDNLSDDASLTALKEAFDRRVGNTSRSDCGINFSPHSHGGALASAIPWPVLDLFVASLAALIVPKLLYMCNM